MKSGFKVKGMACHMLCWGMVLSSPLVHAQCQVNNAFNAATHYLVNGIWKTPPPKLIFKLPGDSLGDGSAVWTDSLNYAGGGRTLANHVRFRIAVKNKSSHAMAMRFDSSSPLSCIDCAANVTIPMSKLSWVESHSGETRGNTPGNGQFNNGTQSLIHVPRPSDNIFNLKFNFANDEVYPAGTYTGEFKVLGIPQ